MASAGHKPKTSQGLAFTFTLMHLADAFIQSELHCIQNMICTSFDRAFPGNQTYVLQFKQQEQEFLLNRSEQTLQFLHFEMLNEIQCF